jgi:hypothetical protein
MPIDTEWERTIDAMVQSTISFQWAVYPFPGDQAVRTIEAGGKYRLQCRIRNKGSEVHFDRVQVRIVACTPTSFGEAPQPPFQFHSDDTFQKQIERKDFDFEGVAPGAGREFSMYFVSNVTASNKGGLTPFEVGIYAQVRPEGHDWRTERW